jgi:PIN domain nuclease of toxin-antitoxin system
MNAGCVDTGVLSIYFSNEVTDAVKKLMEQCKSGEKELHVLKPVLVEAFKHVCYSKGIDIARTTIASFLKDVPVILADLDINLIFKAGTLKCQNDQVLSYIDSMCIAYALNLKIPLHTTEKLLKKIPNSTLERLKVVKYKF